MKKLILNLFALLFSINIWAQAPQMMSYQAVVRDAANALVISSPIGMQISILQGSPTGNEVYIETQIPSTNSNGLATIEIGNGTVVSGTFSDIDWANGPFFLKTETDPDGGTNYTIAGTSELNSVPYALYALNSGGQANSWSVDGNTGNNQDDVFGTNDSAPIRIQVHNIPSGLLDSASQNTYFGVYGGNMSSVDASGSPNTAVGFRALASNTTGSRNTALGANALRDNVTGVNNTAMGHASLQKNTTGNDNTGIGFCQLTDNTTGSYNTALGTWALFRNTTGSYNTAVGDSALIMNTEGSPNTAVGFRALASNTTGSRNTALGANALRDNVTGVNNTAMGHASLQKNTTGNDNTGIGFCQLTDNTTGSYNTALGTWALFRNTTGSYNTAVGDSALIMNTEGSPNTAVGFRALASNTTGSRNTALGAHALRDNITGVNNTAMGHASLQKNTTGNDNTGIGFCQLTDNTTGSYNTALGTWALFRNTTGSYNTAVGDSALILNTIGSNNTALGYMALSNNLTGINNTAIGAKTDLGQAANNSTVIGYQATANEDNVIVLGNNAIQKLYCAQTSITAISDGRFKRNIKSDIHGLDFIMKLKPVSYNLDVSKLNDYQGKEVDEKDLEGVKQAELIRHNGFIAQDVEKATMDLNYDFSGLKTPANSSDIYGLGYTDFVVPLVKAVQELKETNDELKNENAALKTQLANQMSLISNLQSAQANSDKEFAELKDFIYSQTSVVAKANK